MIKKKIDFINREISWLSFNDRVLQEAEDVTVPLIERIKFLGIFSNNRDEFFRVRVATLKRMTRLAGSKVKDIIGESPTELLDRIQHTVIDQQNKFEKIYLGILKELKNENVFIINEKQLSLQQGAHVVEYFRDQVLPTLFPIMLDGSAKFPYLKDKYIYLIIKLSHKNKSLKSKYALVEVPTDILSRFFVLPAENEKKYIMLLDDVIRYCLDDVLYIFDYDAVEAYTIKLTRDAELDLDNDLSRSLADKISRSLKKRKKGVPVRIVYDSKISPDMLNFVMKKIKLGKEDNPIPGGRYHNFKDFLNFPNLGITSLKNKAIRPLNHPELSRNRSLFKAIRENDILLTYPYQSFHHVIDLLREASIDPKVLSIQITLYRVAVNSNIVNALINAVKNGKSVTAVLELRARFDEEANIYWANKLQEEGATVIHGVPGLKVHTKLFLIHRKEAGSIVKYAHLGTGNFNENTAKIYSDHTLLTADKRITDEVDKMFGFYSDNFKTGIYKHLIVSPFFMRKKIIFLIQKEINNAKLGKEAYMILKLNSLVDMEVIKKLYEASRAGVKIKLIIRGICSLVTGIKGQSENIEAISIIDKYLEHSRVFIFCNGGDEKYFISSADWMIRNLDHRSEVIIPIYNKKIQKEIRKIIEIQLSDNTKARMLNRKQDNQYKTNGAKIKVRSQESIYTYLKQKDIVEFQVDKIKLSEIRSN